MRKLPYDYTDPLDIERYAQKLVGYSFYDILKDNIDDEEELEAKRKYYNNSQAKGGLGNLLEKYYFMYEPNNDSEPDFIEAGTELKLTPYYITKTGKISAKERLVLTMIPFYREVDDDFYDSHLFKKIKLMLIIWYLREEAKERVDYNLNFVKLFNLLDEKYASDLDVIIEDYKKIIEKIKDGKAHGLSESETRYLGACPKGNPKSKSYFTEQYYGKELAGRRAFSFKTTYMSYVLNHYILNKDEELDSIFKENELDYKKFDEEIINRISKYKNLSEDELYLKFDISDSKQSNNRLVMAMLDVDGENAQEFEKANIHVKTIRVDKNKKPKESMSFPAFKILDLVDEDWYDSEIYNFFEQTRFLFVVFQESEDGRFILNGAKFWNMSVKDLEVFAKNEWAMYRDKFNEGINFNYVRYQSGYSRMLNDLPKYSQTKVLHVRPHAGKSAYLIDNVRYGNGPDRNMDILPNGDMMTKQCFWLNHLYIKEQIKDLIN